MDNDLKAMIRQRYADRLASHGNSIEALASGTEERRTTRFHVLSEIGISSGDSVLDVGCGLAHFYEYLTEQGINVAYTGIDIVPELIDSAMANHPELDLSVRDLQELPYPEQSFDYVVCSQVFNLRLSEGQNEQLVSEMLELMHKIARKGVVVDFLTSYVDYQEEHLFYYSPETLFRQAKQLTRRVTLRHDYPLFEFCLYLYPSFSGWSP